MTVVKRFHDCLLPTHQAVLDTYEKVKKLQVIDGELAPMSDSGENAIAVAAETDDNGNLMDGDSLPKPGDTVTVTYIDEGYFIDSRTGEKSSENTPGKYIKYKVARSHDVRYTVYAVVSVPYSMSFRYSDFSSIDVVINSERLRADRDARDLPDVLHVRCARSPVPEDGG